MINIKFITKKYKITPKDICYIGANEGQEMESLLLNYSKSKIHAFEPQKVPFEKLYKKFKKYNNIYFYNFALGSEDKKTKMFTNSNNSNMSSSILQPTKHTELHPKILFEGIEHIECFKFSNLNIENVDFLNIDVQGYELEVLKGFSNLEDVNYIITEVNRKELYKDSTLVKDLDKYLKRFGFIRVETIWRKKTIPWGDALYIKRTNLSFFTIILKTLKNSLQNIKGYYFLIAILVKTGFINRNS